jgi:hypothetical protein
MRVLCSDFDFLRSTRAVCVPHRIVTDQDTHDLRMGLSISGSLEAVDSILSDIDGGRLAATEAINRLLSSQITLRNCRFAFMMRLFAFHDETFCLAVSFSGREQGFQRGPMLTHVVRGPVLHAFYQPMQAGGTTRMK